MVVLGVIEVGRHENKNRSESEQAHKHDKKHPIQILCEISPFGFVVFAIFSIFRLTTQHAEFVQYSTEKVLRDVLCDRVFCVLFHDRAGCISGGGIWNGGGGWWMSVVEQIAVYRLLLIVVVVFVVVLIVMVVVVLVVGVVFVVVLIFMVGLVVW